MGSTSQSSWLRRDIRAGAHAGAEAGTVEEHCLAVQNQAHAQLSLGPICLPQERTGLSHSNQQSRKHHADMPTTERSDAGIPKMRSPSPKSRNHHANMPTTERSFLKRGLLLLNDTLLHQVDKHIPAQCTCATAVEVRGQLTEASSVLPPQCSPCDQIQVIRLCPSAFAH